MLDQSGFDPLAVGEPVDTFSGAAGEGNARTFDVHGYAFLARKRYGLRSAPALSRPAETGRRRRSVALEPDSPRVFGS